ncbi:hypothetical protein M8J77_012273 [Diaphorina citri]|nr:hypothetical protein M8J77_021777 [Diaphorina citri]KAI5747205.1 hypothetical protein M8J77_012273 [Diaphorina citri]
MSDSQAAVKALSSFTFESKLTWECLDTLKLLARNNYVTLTWVPGHEGIDGNETADELAKIGTTLPFVGPEPFCGVSKSHLKMEIRKWENQMKVKHWTNISGHRQAKKFITHSPKRAKEMLCLSKEDLRSITGLYTGHCSLNYHLNKMGIAETPTCRLCKEAPETAEHIICECGVASHKRLIYFSRMIITPKEVKEISPKRTLAFVRSLGLF